MPAENDPCSAPFDPSADPARRTGSGQPVRAPTPADVSTHSGSSWKHETVLASSEPPARYEHFEILRREDGSPWRLGRGAMGATYKALDTRLHHHVALKVISAELTGYPAARERFLREARTAARLHHPNVARVFHLGETAGGSEAFYAMEFVEGETLEARVRRAGPLSVWLAVEVGIEVARALVAACHQDLIHRDLKPANLMLVTTAEAATLAAVGRDSSHGEMREAWVKVIDFGLAKAVADAGPLTGAGEFIGTPAYASPEQFESNVGAMDSRSDIYSLGGTLWYALTGKMPFAGRSLTQIHKQKLSSGVPTAQLDAAGVPAPLARLLTSMLAADPGDRPQTPTLLLEALRRCREELHQLSPATPGERATGSLAWNPLRSWWHRRIYQVFFSYAVGAWLLLQTAAIVLPGLGWPHWIMRPLIVTLLAGFGEALLLGWALDRQAAGKARLPQRTARRVGFLLLALAPAFGSAAFFLWQPSPTAADSRAVASNPTGGGSTRSEGPAISIPAKSIAVLPFEDFSAGKEDVYFADGVQDEILTDLAKIADLKVISRTSVAQYKRGEPRNLREIAAQLGVANVLEGSVQRAGNQIRVTAQLIDARTDTHRWAEHYDRDLADVFAIQSEIAQAIAGQLQVRLSPREKGAIDSTPTHDLTAYGLYLQAREQQQAYFKVSDDIRRNAHREVSLLDQAVARDPEFVLAYCELARAHDQLYSVVPSQPDETLPVDHRGLAEAALNKARRLQPDSGEVHLAQATHFLYTKGDLSQGRIEVDLAMRFLPGSAWAKYMASVIARRQNRWAEAVRFQEEAVALAPRDTNMLDELSRTYRILRRYADFDRTLARIIAILPLRDTMDARFGRALGRLEASGDLAPLRAAVAAAASIEVDDSDREDIENHRIALAVLERDANTLSKLLVETTQRRGLLLYGIRYPLAYYQALAATMRGDHAGEQSAFAAARIEVEKSVLADDNNGLALSVLAVIDARLGHVEEALREAKRACELTPPEKSRVSAASVASNLIIVYAWTQHTDLAINELSSWLDQPAGYGLPFHLSYGDLRLNPFYDPLRGDPRFIALLQQFAPAPGC